MAVTEEIAWGDGSGDKIYLTADALTGTQVVSVSSDANMGGARSKTVTFSASGVSPVVLTVAQEASVSTIPYIRGGKDGSYIDTGITADNTVKVIVWARNLNPVTSGALFGAQISTSDESYLVGTYTEQFTGRLRINYNKSTVYADNQFENLSWYHKYELYQGVLKVDDTIVCSTTDSTFNTNYNIHLFGVNRGGAHIRTGNPIDICAAKIYKNGDLVRDFTPVQSPSVGFYDAVSGTVFTNSGSGNLSYSTFNKDAFIRLKYVSCTNSYIDTGVYGKKSIGYTAVKFRITDTAIGWPNVFGNMRSGTAGSYYLFELSSTQYPNAYADFYLNTSSNNRVYSSTGSRLTNLDLIFCTDSSSYALLVYNNAVKGTKKTFTRNDFTTSPDTILLGTTRIGGSASGSSLHGYIYYAGFGDERSFVPAKVNNEVGLYDTYNDVFYTSDSGTSFVAGPEV